MKRSFEPVPLQPRADARRPRRRHAVRVVGTGAPGADPRSTGLRVSIYHEPVFTGWGRLASSTARWLHGNRPGCGLGRGAVGCRGRAVLAAGHGRVACFSRSRACFSAAVASCGICCAASAAADSSAARCAAASSRAARAALTDRSASARSSRSRACFTRTSSSTATPGLSATTASSAARNTWGGSSIRRSTSLSITTGSPGVATTARLSAACCRISELPSSRHPRMVATAFSHPRRARAS
mmetsp:Transcript_86878/g.198338  ORF Transcript_86878/g.198338 Transcript_86878/m.198338 type:complete len:241 (+) Transcript_86878:53-775(+)